MKTIHYPDLWLRLLGIPFLAAFLRHFGATESLYELFQNKQYYIDLSWNLLIVTALWETNRFIIRLMDKRYSWVYQPIERFLVQAGLVLAISFIEVTGLIYLYNDLLLGRDGMFTLKGLVVLDLSLTFVFVVLINFIYTGMYLVHYHFLVIERLVQERDEAIRVAEKLKLDSLYNENTEAKPSPYQEHLIVNYGHASVPLISNEIAYIFRINEKSHLRTFDGKEYTSSSSLESLETLMNPALFFRINHHMLTHVRSIRKCKTDTHGKLEVEFTPAFPQEVFVSRRKASEFKEWLGKKI
jgi:DNA-binding LytR/AlgR family response regulator